MEEVLDIGLEAVDGQEGGEGQQQAPPDPKQADREYSNWIKSLKEDGDSGKHYRRIKDDYSRLQTLSRLDPKGIDGVRERYAALDGVAYGDKKGIEAVSTMRTALAESQTVLDAIAQGDLTQLGDEQRQGITRMAPKILDMLAESDADGYVKAILPHFVDALKGSQLYSAFGQLVDTLSQEPPKWMRPEQKADWINDRLQAVLGHATTMGQWFKAQEDRAKGLGAAGGVAGHGAEAPPRNQCADQRHGHAGHVELGHQRGDQFVQGGRQGLRRELAGPSRRVHLPQGQGRRRPHGLVPVAEQARQLGRRRPGG